MVARKKVVSGTKRKKAASQEYEESKEKSITREEMHKELTGISENEQVLKKGEKLLKEYAYTANKMPITVRIIQSSDSYVPYYTVSISKISENTAIILERLRKEIATQVSLGIIDIVNVKKTGVIEERFKEAIDSLLGKYFPDVEEDSREFLRAYLVQKSLGLGDLEILMKDSYLEEIAINNASDPVWIYHRLFGWLKTNIYLDSEDQTKHYASIMGRRVGRQITILEPLLDANLSTGDRVNATLMPVSLSGNTITLRKFASKPWTITDFINSKTSNANAASLIWLAVQYELSALIAGGTASGKTSMLNVVANFFPPNQRIISIEDTHEIQLPSFLHWLPMLTRLPNPEGKGGVSMLDLLVNALRQRPDRIVVGEIRRKAEAEVLFEAIHTGHSVYATVHANNAKETVTRLTNPPISVPKTMLPALQLIVVQYRNRRSGMRRTFQIAEISEDSEANVLMQYDPNKDLLKSMNNSKTLMSTLELYTGFSKREIEKDLNTKQKVLNYLVKQEINTVEKVGTVMAEYYTNQDYLLKHIAAGKKMYGR
ncbi:MAG: type II/IV secretion system ATPase subunit [Candidatus Woesearchaeota archaeon]